MRVRRRRRTDGKGLAGAVRVDEGHGQEVRFRHRGGVRDGEGVLKDRLDGPPDVDDLVAAFEGEGRFIGGEVVVDALGAGGVGLVDVDALDGAAEGGAAAGWVGGCWLGAADGVVEDQDFGGAGAGGGRMVVSLLHIRGFLCSMVSLFNSVPKKVRRIKRQGTDNRKKRKKKPPNRKDSNQRNDDLTHPSKSPQSPGNTPS